MRKLKKEAKKYDLTVQEIFDMGVPAAQLGLSTPEEAGQLLILGGRIKSLGINSEQMRLLTMFVQGIKRSARAEIKQEGSND